jgi:ABC-type glutathione transport system ATPase component
MIDTHPLISTSEDFTIEARGIERDFGSGRAAHRALRGIDLDVTSRSSIGIVGESGSGKSTLSRLLTGLDRATSGTVKINGYSVPALARSSRANPALRRVVQYVPQDTSASFEPRQTMRVGIARPARILLGLSKSDANRRVDELCEQMGLSPDVADRYPSQISGGQRQRLALARALIVGPRVLVCDEVVSALDVSVQGAILNLIKQTCAELDCGLVFVSHGLPATAFIADEIIVMYRGEIVERGASRQIVNDPRHPYTASLISAYRLGDDFINTTTQG